MTPTLLKTITMLALAAFCSLALADPPGRVGRISSLSGDVSFRDNTDEDAFPASLNWPVTSNNLISTAPGSRAEVQVGSAAVRIAADSELEIVQLDDQHFRLWLNYGSVAIRIASQDMAQDFELETTQGRVLLKQPAQFRIDARRGQADAAVSVFSGTLRFEGRESSITVAAGKRLEIIDDTFSTGAVWRDDFDDWSLARDRQYEDSVSHRYVSREMTGYAELDLHGTWRVAPDYGAVWVPRQLALGWAPYRQGRWVWVDPWGWTWVDQAPWAFATSHYGRWLWLDRRWCWSPGKVVAHPVWAPALVGWIGTPHRGTDRSGPAVGWVPLAPGEVYVPGYHVSSTYIRQLNLNQVSHVRHIDEAVSQFRGDRSGARTPGASYRNHAVRDAVTLLPQDQFIKGRTVLVTPAQVMADRGQAQWAPMAAPRPLTMPSVRSGAPDAARWRERRRGEGQMQGNVGNASGRPAVQPPHQPGRPATVFPSSPGADVSGPNHRSAAPGPGASRQPQAGSDRRDAPRPEGPRQVEQHRTGSPVAAERGHPVQAGEAAPRQGSGQKFSNEQRGQPGIPIPYEAAPNLAAPRPAPAVKQPVPATPQVVAPPPRQRQIVKPGEEPRAQSQPRPAEKGARPGEAASTDKERSEKRREELEQRRDAR